MMNLVSTYHILTVTHRDTNVKRIREFVTQSPQGEEPTAELVVLKENMQLDELFYLATCNRVMYFFATPRPVDSSFLYRFLGNINPDFQYQPDEEWPMTHYQGNAAIQHLLYVASSIDSLVVGERQILGQLRTAYDQCKALGITGDKIRMAIQHAVRAAKDIYAHTQIGEKPISIVSLAIQKMLHTPHPRNPRIVMIGAGETNELVAKFLDKHHLYGATVFNRTVEKAEKIATLLKGTALPLSDLPHYTGGFDILIVCTGSTQPIVNIPVYSQLAGAAADNKEEKIVIDLSIPHNVDEAVLQHFPIHYIEIESLRSLADENIAFRQQEVEKAKITLESYIHDFPNILRERRLELAFSQVPLEIKEVKLKALNEVFRKEVESLDPQARELMERMLTYMEKKCIGIPMKVAKEVVLP